MLSWNVLQRKYQRETPSKVAIRVNNTIRIALPNKWFSCGFSRREVEERERPAEGGPFRKRN